MLGSNMLHRFKLRILLQGLTLFLLGPGCEGSSLGLTVHVVPLESDGGKTVRAHFSAIAPSPCPALSGLCAVGEDCLVHPTSLPFNGTKPTPGWCVRQWQKTVPSNYKASISLGSNTEMYVSMKAGPVVRADSGRLNQPAYVALPPPLRAVVNCPHHFYLSVKDLDGDRVRCRFAQPDQGECLNCTQYSFTELDEEKCILTFTGKAPAGQYFIYLMAEDLIPEPKTSHATDNTPLSSVPVHLSLTVAESTSSCIAEPVATDETPSKDSTLSVLPYQETKLSVSFMSQLESVLEVVVVGPPELYRTDFKSVSPLSTITMAWVRSENKLASLLPICFAANTMSLQSEARCVWLYQKKMGALPAGTELKCEKTEMTLVLPVASLTNINMSELQLNSPTCPVAYNNTHLTAHIFLNGCGTKTVHSGSELVYTNTLRSVRPFTMVSRQPTLILPLACRFPETQVKGPQYKIGIPSEKEAFGEFGFWIEFHFPGEGPLATFTRFPKFHSLQRVRRDVESPSGRIITSKSTSNSTSSRGAIGSRINQLDLHVLSNCSINHAKLIVSNCSKSETEDFAETKPILEQGCATSINTLEIVTNVTNSKVYRLDLNSLQDKGSTMYVQCTVNLCIATMPSEMCPDLCNSSISQRILVSSVFTKTYTIRSGPVSLVVTTPAPSTTKTLSTATTTTKSVAATASSSIVAQNCVISQAPEQTSSMAAGVILTTISIFLQNIFLY